MKIAMIGQKGIPAIYGGVEKHVEELAVGLANRWVQVTVYNRRWFSSCEKNYKGVNMVTVPSIYTKHLDTIVHTFLSTLHAVFTKHDIIHFHGVGPSLLAWLPRILTPRAKIVTTFHCIDRKHAKWGTIAKIALRLGEWCACKFAHKTIAVSEAITLYADSAYDCKAEYIPNGITKAKPILTDQNIKEKFGLTKNEYVIAVTRLIPHKGVHYLISAFRQLETNKKLIIVGAGHFTDQYVQYLNTIARGDERIKFLGWQTGEILPELYSNAYLIVQPSEAEGMSLVLLEAMNWGCPVLTSDIPENRETVKNYGWYFQVGNTFDLKKQLAHVLSLPPNELAQKAKQAQFYVQNNFEWGTIVDATLQVYNKLVTNKSLKTLHSITATSVMPSSSKSTAAIERNF